MECRQLVARVPGKELEFKKLKARVPEADLQDPWQCVDGIDGKCLEIASISQRLSGNSQDDALPTGR